jgi:flagellar FliJ protein
MLLQHEQGRRDLAAEALHRAEQSARRSREQAAQLLAYRIEYEARWAAQLRLRASIEIVHCWRAFMQRLDQAVALQARQVQAGEAALGAARRTLLDAERRVAAVRKLIERREAERRAGVRRREHRLEDELAQRMRRAMPAQAFDGTAHEPAAH